MPVDAVECSDSHKDKLHFILKLLIMPLAETKRKSRFAYMQILFMCISGHVHAKSNFHMLDVCNSVILQCI